MIHDKDYIIRIVKQFNEFLSKIILGGSSGSELTEFQRIFDTNMNDTFKMSFDELSSKSTEEITQIINEKDTSHHLPYFELLGHLFFHKYQKTGNKDFGGKAKTFYEMYLQKSGIFSLPLINRINEIKKES
ncbi:MAG: hypothetical protein QM564_07690 [Bergeyella sp.]